MILAAGEGSRLRPLTYETPKPMLHVAGMPILEHNVRLLAAHGIDHIVINLHHRPEVVTRYFGDGSRFGVSIAYSHEERLLGTAGALKNVERLFQGDDFLLVYGDNLTTLALGDLIAAHRAKSATVTMALFERERPESSGIVALDEEDRIVRFLEKPSPSEVFGNWVNAGFLVFHPRVFDYIRPGVSDFGRDVFGALIIGGERAYGYRMSERLWWIDSLEDYERTIKELGERHVTDGVL